MPIMLKSLISEKINFLKNILLSLVITTTGNEWQYIFVAFLLIVTFGLGLALYKLSYLGSLQNPYTEKTLGYECGFNPYDDARLKFDIHFYLVAILFILFDLEILFLFPWIASFSFFWRENPFAIFSGLVFLLILTIGFLYEWKKGALDWW